MRTPFTIGIVANPASGHDIRRLVSQASVFPTNEPALVIWGGKDRIIAASHASGLPATVKVEVLPEAGHMVQMEAAGAVNRFLGAFWA